MIAVFSGTGNSRYVADVLAERLGDDVMVYPDRVSAGDGDRVVWVFPVYSWGVPPVVMQWIKNSDIAGSNAWAVMTCGDDAGNTADQWRRLMSGAGAKAYASFTVIMPNTYVLMKGFDVDSEAVAEAKLAAAPARVRQVAETIAAGAFRGDDVCRGRFAAIKSGVIYPWFVRHAMSPRPFHATDACVGCGICARMCPLDNIVMENKRPAWGDNCALCLRCYHICPHKAVAYGKATRGKSRYTRLMHCLVD